MSAMLSPSHSLSLSVSVSLALSGCVRVGAFWKTKEATTSFGAKPADNKCQAWRDVAIVAYGLETF